MLLGCCACTTEDSKISVVLENDRINSEVIKSLDASEKALLSWYLYAYGNACENNSAKFKCQILEELNIDDECNPEHLSNLMQWFSKDLLAPSKLNNCPNITSKSAIQNKFLKIVLIKQGDTLSIDYQINGLNNSQEKSWNFDKVDKYLINTHALIKIRNN